MGVWNVEGEWSGRYYYDLVNDLYPPEGVPFQMSLTEGWFGRFRGKVQDDAARGGIPEKGRIRGRIRGDRISFLKRMPIYHVAGGATMAEHILEHYRVDVRRDLRHPPIRYVGQYDFVEDRATGRWSISPYKSLFWGHGRLLCIRSETTTGTWEIRRGTR
ncbi:MAG: hypothetical protein P4L85_27470 [Paludisphaera borealis]|uniref:hypothetical protein n=1 Tax=Paludisphaera borealis TaxID=1387353 RepID=UPI00285173F6|nr:hypothetical protein [Paludisphaera borealis]MDR3623123.1 hypothetical protein [Paludisphaera borealis]